MTHSQLIKELNKRLEGAPDKLLEELIKILKSQKETDKILKDGLEELERTSFTNT